MVRQALPRWAVTSVARADWVYIVSSTEALPLTNLRIPISLPVKGLCLWSQDSHQGNHLPKGRWDPKTFFKKERKKKTTFTRKEASVMGHPDKA